MVLLPALTECIMPFSDPAFNIQLKLWFNPLGVFSCPVIHTGNDSTKGREEMLVARKETHL